MSWTAFPTAEVSYLGTMDRVIKASPMLLYVAGPYRGNVEENIAKAREAAMAVWEAGHYAICPHLNTAHFDRDTQVDEQHFLNGTMEMMRRCDGLVVLPGWQQSEGTLGEMAEANDLGLPMWFYPEIPHV